MAADKLVSGVFVELPLTDPEGVVVPVGVEAESLPLLPFAACLAAFSANRFCFEADFTGGIVIGRWDGVRSVGDGGVLQSFAVLGQAFLWTGVN